MGSYNTEAMQEDPNKAKNPNKDKVHRVLAHSYFIYFFFFLVGILLDILFPLRIFSDSFMIPIGLFFVIIASVLVFWSQKSSNIISKENLSKKSFQRGPYKYVSNPTHWGLFLMLLGFGIAINALYLALFTILYFLVDHLIFLKKQNSILEEKYGEHFREYKRSVRF